MNKIKTILTIVALLAITNTTYANTYNFTQTPFVLRKQQSKNKQVDFKNLRTTFIPGIYCQIVSDKGTYSQQKHYFYNTEKQELVEIPGVYYISPKNFKKALGKLLPEFEKYGAKTDEFTYKGRKYKVPTY